MGNEDRCSEENGVLPLFVHDLKAGVRSERQRNDRIEKTCQPSAMKHPNKTSALRRPIHLRWQYSYYRILVKHGLIEKTLSIPDAYEAFLKVGADPLLRGWIEYYGRYAPSALYPLLRHVNRTLIAWAMRKFKRFKGHKVRASQFLQRLATEHRSLFVHWDIGMTGVSA